MKIDSQKVQAVVEAISNSGIADAAFMALQRDVPATHSLVPSQVTVTLQLDEDNGELLVSIKYPTLARFHLPEHTHDTRTYQFTRRGVCKNSVDFPLKKQAKAALALVG